MAEQYDPLAFVLLGKVDFSLRGHRFKRRRFIADAGHADLNVVLNLIHSILQKMYSLHHLLSKGHAKLWQICRLPTLNLSYPGKEPQKGKK
jgi:hypothetical protein